MQRGEREVYFVDAAHFVWSAFLGYVWFWERLFISAPAGRQRFNVLGALNANNHQLITVTNDTYINALSVCELLRQIAAIGHLSPVTLVLDNAKYQHAGIVTALASELGIELCYWPAYSPNLNLIERLWRFVKNKWLYNKFYPCFKSFRDAINECLEKTGSHAYKSELETLLSLRFQKFSDVPLMG